MAEFLFHSGGRVKPIAMIRAYVDESGTHKGSPLLVVAAYIGTSRVWESVEKRFKKADRHSGVPFHAVDCATGGKDFKHMDAPKRNRLTKKMIKIVCDHNITGMVEGAWTDDYFAAFPIPNGVRYELWLQTLYGVLFQNLLWHLSDHVHKTYPGEPLSIAVENSDEWYPVAARIFLSNQKDASFQHAHLLETIAPYSPKQAVQLYAADILAYEAYLARAREKLPNKRQPRKSLLALLKKQIDGEMFALNVLTELRKLADASGIAYPGGKP
jgi:hypothetical protein